jgi:NADH-quinone oxidoreductase subunit J
MLVQVLFYAFATVLIASALGVIVARNPVHSALALVMCFVTSAAIWLLIEAEFLAVVLVLVYVGAVMVLFLFVVMMLDINLEELRKGFTRFAWLGWLTALAVIGEIVGVVAAHTFGLDVSKGATPQPAGYSNTTELGHVLYTEFAYPFELAAMVLLVAIVAAISLTMRRRPGYKAQDISRQVAVRARDRLRIVKMRPEKVTEPAPDQPAHVSQPAADAGSRTS